MQGAKLLRLDESDLPSNTRFGWIFAAIFLAFGVYLLFYTGILKAIAAFAIGMLFGTLARFRPKTLEPLNKAWALLGLLLGKVFGTVVIGVVFFVVLTPISLVFKAIKRDELRLRRSVGETYWRMRDASDSSSSFRDQF